MPDVLGIEDNAANEDAKSEDDIKQNVKQEIMAAIEMCDSDDTDDLEESSELSSSEDEKDDDMEERKDGAGRKKPKKKSSKHVNGYKVVSSGQLKVAEQRESYISGAMSGALSNPLANPDEEYKD